MAPNTLLPTPTRGNNQPPSSSQASSSQSKNIVNIPLPVLAPPTSHSAASDNNQPSTSSSLMSVYGGQARRDSATLEEDIKCYDKCMKKQLHLYLKRLKEKEDAEEFAKIMHNLSLHETMIQDQNEKVKKARAVNKKAHGRVTSVVFNHQDMGAWYDAASAAWHKERKEYDELKTLENDRQSLLHDKHRLTVAVETSRRAIDELAEPVRVQRRHFDRATRMYALADQLADCLAGETVLEKPIPDGLHMQVIELCNTVAATPSVKTEMLSASELALLAISDRCRPVNVVQDVVKWYEEEERKKKEAMEAASADNKQGIDGKGEKHFNEEEKKKNSKRQLPSTSSLSSTPGSSGGSDAKKHHGNHEENHY